MEITSEELSRLDRQLHCCQRNIHQKAVGSLGLHYGQPLMLMILLDHQPLFQKELAHRMNVTPASVTVSVKRMEKSGWVEKTTNQEDLRYVAIRLTAKGEAIARRCREEMQRIDQEKYVGFTPQEREQLADFYRRMAANLQTLKEETEA